MSIGTHDIKDLSLNPKRLLEKFDSADQHLAKRKSGPHMRWMAEHADDEKLIFPKWDLSNGVPTFARSWTDFESGLAVIVGQPNSGKTTILVSLHTGSLELNDDTIIVDISLDDPIRKRYVQWLANLSGLRYSEVSSPSSLTTPQTRLLDAAKEKLRGWVSDGRLFPFESQETSLVGVKHRNIDGVDAIRNEVRKFNTRHYQTLLNLMRRFRDKYPDKKIIFTIDAWNNLDYTSAHGSSDLTQMNFMLDAIQEVSNQEEIKVIVSAHARKTMNKRVTLEDIKGTKNMEYNCVWGGVVRNEYRENVYLEPLIYTDGDRDYPVLTIEIGKTKVSSWDMPLFYALMSDQCRLKPLTTYEYETMMQMYQGSNRKMKGGGPTGP